MTLRNAKNCPVCGARPKTGKNFKGMFAVYCEQDKHPIVFGETKDEAIENWNNEEDRNV